MGTGKCYKSGLFFLENPLTSTPLLVKLFFLITPLGFCLIPGTIKADKGESKIVILLAKAPHISDFSGQAEVSAVATRKTATDR